MMTCIEKIVSSTFHGYFLIFVNPNDLDLERIDRKSPTVKNGLSTYTITDSNI